MSQALIIRKVQAVLNASGRCDNGAEVARDFAKAVNLLNRRLDACKDFLYQGQIGEAIRTAEERPPLFEICELFLFDRLPMWQSMCQTKGWTQAEAIESSLVNVLKDALSSPNALGPLVELHRNAERVQNIRAAVRYLRCIVKLDREEKRWSDKLVSFEEQYLSELKNNFFPALALSDTTTMHRIAEEIESGNWSVAIDPSLLSSIGEMRKVEKKIANMNENRESSDSDLFQTAPDDEVKSEPPSTPVLPVTTTKVDGDQRVEGWTPTAKGLLVACLILGALLLMGLSGLLWYGKEHYRKACDEIVSQNKQLLEERSGSEYIGIKGELEKGNYKESYKPLRELVKREKSKMAELHRKTAEAESARKQAEEAALECKKAEEAEAERLRVEAEKLKKAEQQAAELKRMEEDALKNAAEVDAANERKKIEALAAERKRIEEAELKRAEAAVAARKRLEELDRKKAEEIVAQRKRAEEEALLQNSGFDSQRYMVVDLAGGTSATQYPIVYHTAEADVPGGVQDEAYKTTKLLLRYIAPGTYMMGSPKDQLGYDETQPPTEMSVTNGFFIGVFEVTQKQWELVMGANPSYFEDASASASRPVEQVSCYEIRENSKTNKHDPDSNWPANQYVSENSFMGKLRMKTGIHGFDLPTEIQWEYACRAGTTTALNSGKNITNMYIDPSVAEVGRYYSNGGRGYKRDGATRIMTAPVGSYKPNAWGLYDMHGNVSEWCLDWRRLGSVSEPRWKGTVVEQYCVLRGGGWDNVAWHCLATSRAVNKPFQRNYNAGFRVLRNKAYSFSSTVSSR